MTQLSKKVLNNFNTTIDTYEKKNLSDLLKGSNVSPQKYRQILTNELERSVKLQNAFIKNPQSFFASAMFCAELNLSPSSLVGEFYFIVKDDMIKPVIGYKGLVTLLLRSSKTKKIWAEVVFAEDDFTYELGLEPKLIHKPNFNSKKSFSNIKYVYVCAKLEDDIIFKVMTLEELKTIVDMLETPNDFYFNDKIDPNFWMLKKIVLKQLSKLMPKDDDRLVKAVSFDDKIETGSYVVLDEDESVTLVEGTIINKKSSLYQNLIKNGNQDNY